MDSGRAGLLVLFLFVGCVLGLGALEAFVHRFFGHSALRGLICIYFMFVYTFFRLLMNLYILLCFFNAIYVSIIIADEGVSGILLIYCNRCSSNSLRVFFFFLPRGCFYHLF